ncbi:MAG: coproporphyrinogen III oxidase [Gammaproteobacteria bacterium]|nr:coproporphyrinogen III oxidase [Gammaproteobacteria bacterium]
MAVFLTLVALIWSPLAAADGEFSRLTAEQTAKAKRALQFLDEMEALYFGTVAKLNGNDEIESVDINDEFALRNVKVMRGPVVEKAGRMRTHTLKPKADFQDERLWTRFFSADVHPKTPKVGMLHAAITMHFDADGGSAVAGWVDILPAATSPEDLDHLKAVADEIFAKYGKDAARHRRMSIEGTEGEGMRRREPAGVGGSFYGRDLMPWTEENFAFMTEMYREFFRAYLNLIDQRQNDPVTAEDLAKQDYQRRNWWEDRWYSDPYTRNVVPMDVWALSTLPPEVKF